MYFPRFRGQVVTTLVVLLVVASTVPMTAVGSAAVDEDDYDDRLASGGTFWQGQELLFDGSQVVSNVENANAADRTFQIRRVSSDNGVGSLVGEFVVDADGQHAIRTQRIDGRVVIRYQGETVYVENGIGHTGTRPDDGAITVQNSRWEVAVQTISARWSDNSIREGGSSTLEIESNRARFVIGVSAEGLDFDDLAAIFSSQDYADDHDAEEDDDIIRLDAGADAELDADFEDIRPRTYPFTVEVVDTTARSTTSLDSQSPPTRIGFVDTTIREDVGDITTFSVRMGRHDTAYVVIGGKSVNFLDVLEIRDTSGDGRVTATMNTRYAGLNPTSPGVPDGVSVYGTTRDRVVVYGSSSGLENGKSLNQLRQELGIDTDGLRRPLQPGSYELSVASSDDLRISQSNLNVVDERDVATIDLSDRELDGIQSFTAPTAGAGAERLERLRSTITVSDQVAIGDRVVLGIEISGIHGYIDEEHDGRITALANNAGEGIDLMIEQTNPSANRQPLRIWLRQSGVALVSDASNDTLYVVVDTRNVETPRPLADGQTFRARLRLKGVEEDRIYNLKSTSSASYTGYPFLDPDEIESVSTSFTLRERTVRIDGLINGVLQVQPASNVVVSGTTTLAPGTELQIRHVATGQSPFSKTETVTVRSNRTWRATFDFSDRAIDQRFTTTIRRGGDELTTVDGRVVERIQTPTPTPTPTPEPSPTQTPDLTPTPTSTPAMTPTPTPERSPTPTRTPTATETPGQPGFGIAITMLVMIGFILLWASSSRRRN